MPIVIALGVGVTAAAKQKKQSSSGPRQGSSSASASASASSNSDPVEDSSLGLADEEDGSSGGRLLPGKDGGEGVPADGNALSCFGIVTLASLLPVLTVLMLGFWLLATQVVLVWVCCRYECLMILVWAVAGGNYRGRRSGQGQVRFASSLAAPSQQMLTHRAPPSPASATSNSTPWYQTSPWSDLIGGFRALTPLVLFMVVVLKYGLAHHYTT